MAAVKCSVCDAVCDDTLVLCSTCGNALPAKQSGFGASVPSEFGVTQQSGFGNPVQDGGDVLQSGFGLQPQSGFGTKPQSDFENLSTESFGTLPVTVQQQPAGFGAASPPVVPSGFGAASLTVAPTSFDTVSQTAGFGESPQGKDVQGASSGFNGMAAESARFADTVNDVLSEEDCVYWSFKQCIFFILKQCIPVYGIIILVMCALGNPTKYPKTITNYIRASLVFAAIVTVIVGIVMAVTAAMAAKMLGM